jgi:hypothetical protein
MFLPSRAVLLALVLTLPASPAVIGLYTFEGNANDVSGNANHGTLSLVAPTITASGYEGSAYQFGSGGANNFITVPIDINATALTAVTVGAWVNADSAGALIRGIISHDTGGFDRTLDVDTRGCSTDPCWSAFTGSGVLSSEVQVTTGEWVFLAVRYNAADGGVSLTVNGVNVGITGAYPGTGHVVTTIGRNPNFDLPFQGRIDNVFFFDEWLSDTRIQEIRRGGVDAILNQPDAQVPEPPTFWLVVIGGAAFVLSRMRH